MDGTLRCLSGDPVAVVLEPCPGGRIYEQTSDGTEIVWGEITTWDPPRRLSYLWHIRRDRSDATDVEITFSEAGDGSTTVEIVHTGWERLGVAGPAWRDSNEGGWAHLIPHFLEACR